MSEEAQVKPVWCTAGCKAGAHVHMDVGDLELWEMPEGFFWAALKVGKKIRDTYYQGPSREAAAEALIHAWGILQAVGIPARKTAARSTADEVVPVVALEHERALDATYRVLSAWNAKLPPESKIKEAEMLLVAGAILNNLRRLARAESIGTVPEVGSLPKREPKPAGRSTDSKAQVAKDLPDHVAKARTRFPRAYEPWSPSEDDRLKQRHGAGATIDGLATEFQRQPGAIRSRLTKLGLIQ